MFPVLSPIVFNQPEPLQSLQAAVKDFGPVTNGALALPPVIGSQSLTIQQQAAQQTIPSSIKSEENASLQQGAFIFRRLELPQGQASGFAAQLYAQQDDSADVYLPRYQPLVSSEGAVMKRSGKINVLTYNAPPYEELLAKGRDTRPYFALASGAYQQMSALLPL